MFAGVGGFRAGLDLAGGFQCIGHCEIDKYADASYRAIHAPGKEEVYYPDARTIDPKELPDFDLLCGGFPCQAFSTAGRRKGFEDARGSLFFELARVVKEKRPLYLFLENVIYALKHINDVLPAKVSGANKLACSPSKYVCISHLLCQPNLLHKKSRSCALQTGTGAARD